MNHKRYSKQLIFSFILGTLFVYGCDEKEAVEEQPPCTEITYYQDADGDGLGNANVTIDSCEMPAGYVENSDDKIDVKASAAGVPMVFKVTGENCPPCGGWGWTAFTDLVDRYEGGKAFSFGNYGSGFSNGHFRSQEAFPTMQALQDRFARNSSKPNFVVNGRNWITSSADAQTAADAFVATTAPVGMVMNARLEGNKLIIDAEAEAFESVTGSYVMGAYLIEDKAMGPQSGSIGVNGDVEHHNVMRGSLSDNAWGELISEDGLTAGNKYEHTFTMDIPSGYNSDNFSYGLIVWKKISTAYVFVNAYSTY